MIKYTELKLNKGDLDKVSHFDNKTKSKINYYNIESGFDIETTSTITTGGDKFAFAYEWTFGIGDTIVYGRTWGEFISLCEYLQSTLELDSNNRLIVYVHNLSFEFQFMRKYLGWESVFATDDRKPIKALCNYGIELRDSYILSGYSLAKLAENLVSHKVEKLVGDLDYSLVRTSETPLTDKELSYCYNDVLIILYYINEQIEYYGNITKIPLTNTSVVRNFCRSNCLYASKNHHKDHKDSNYKKLMRSLILDSKEYRMLHRCFMGGFTHASMLHSGLILEDVSSIDFTSSYPAVMLMEKFPMSSPELITNFTKEDFDYWIESDNIGLMFDIELTNIHSKNTYESYLSEHKCKIVEKPIINNGRIFQADRIVTTITDIDYRIMNKCYSWDKKGIKNLYLFHMEYLPRKLILSILELYENKTTLKGVEGKEVEYMRSKGMLNSVYGMCVTDIVRDDIAYNEEWEVIKVTEDEVEKQIDKYNNSVDRFLYYAWGVWVTAYARRNLWNGILNIGDDYIYSDTDSIKFLNYDKHVKYIEAYNRRVEYKLKRMCDFRKIDFNKCKPKTIKGKIKMIGVWDYEGTYTRFKTLGAKKYMYEENNKLHLTVSGLSKKNGIEYMISQCDSNLEVFEMFTDKLFIPAEHTGKNTHTYIDDEIESEVTDYLGNTTTVKSLSGVHLSECEFSLNIAKEYNNLLTKLRSNLLVSYDYE